MKAKVVSFNGAGCGEHSSCAVMRGREISNHADIRAVFWILFECFCDFTLSPQHPQQQRRQRHRMYLSFILVVGASCLSAEEGHTGDRGALAETNRNLASTRPEPGGVRCRQESCTAREPKVLWYHFGPVGLCHVYDKKRCCAEARESEWARISQVNIRASYACQCDIKDEVGGNLTSVSFRRLLFASNANRAARRGDSNPG